MSLQAPQLTPRSRLTSPPTEAPSPALLSNQSSSPWFVRSESHNLVDAAVGAHVFSESNSAHPRKPAANCCARWAARSVPRADSSRSARMSSTASDADEDETKILRPTSGESDRRRGSGATKVAAPATSSSDRTVRPCEGRSIGGSADAAFNSRPSSRTVRSAMILVGRRAAGAFRSSGVASPPRWNTGASAPSAST